MTNFPMFDQSQDLQKHVKACWIPTCSILLGWRKQQVPPPEQAQQVPPAASPPRILKLHVKCASPPTAVSPPTAASPPTQ